jgi:hypothetical protein
MPPAVDERREKLVAALRHSKALLGRTERELEGCMTDLTKSAERQDVLLEANAELRAQL